MVADLIGKDIEINVIRSGKTLALRLVPEELVA
jgi:hypothetical protein